jgi:hypothetical protein
MPIRTVFALHRLQDPNEIPLTSEAFNAWLAQADKMIVATVNHANEQLAEIGASIADFKKRFASVGGVLK